LIPNELNYVSGCKEHGSKAEKERKENLEKNKLTK
jgi:hypothetical protein